MFEVIKNKTKGHNKLVSRHCINRFVIQLTPLLLCAHTICNTPFIVVWGERLFDMLKQEDKKRYLIQCIKF